VIHERIVQAIINLIKVNKNLREFECLKLSYWTQPPLSLSVLTSALQENQHLQKAAILIPIDCGSFDEAKESARILAEKNRTLLSLTLNAEKIGSAISELFEKTLYDNNVLFNDYSKVQAALERANKAININDQSPEELRQLYQNTLRAAQEILDKGYPHAQLLINDIYLSMARYFAANNNFSDGWSYFKKSGLADMQVRLQLADALFRGGIYPKQFDVESPYSRYQYCLWLCCTAKTKDLQTQYAQTLLAQFSNSYLSLRKSEPDTGLAKSFSGRKTIISFAVLAEAINQPALIYTRQSAADLLNNDKVRQFLQDKFGTYEVALLEDMLENPLAFPLRNGQCLSEIDPQNSFVDFTELNAALENLSNAFIQEEAVNNAEKITIPVAIQQALQAMFEKAGKNMEIKFNEKVSLKFKALSEKLEALENKLPAPRLPKREREHSTTAEAQAPASKQLRK